MRSSSGPNRWVILVTVCVAVTLGWARDSVAAEVTSAEVNQAIRAGARFLKDRQRADGSWPEEGGNALTGTTSLVTLALLTAGEKPDAPVIKNALAFLRRFEPKQLNSTYAIALQTMVFAAVDPAHDRARLVANVDWLERAQHKDPRRESWAGNWPYTAQRAQAGDNSNTQYALLGLNAASEAGIAVRPEVWEFARAYFEHSQNRDGGWGYTPRHKQSTASMTCAGVSSLIISGARQFHSLEYVQGETIHHCGSGATDPFLKRGIDWLGSHFDVHQNLGHGQQYKLYYLYGLERVGRLAALRFLGQNDWYRAGALELVAQQNKISGFWIGPGEGQLVATSFALLFLAKGRAPVLINKLRYVTGSDWNHDADDIRNLVGVVSRDWKNLMTWQVVDPRSATPQDMLQAPVVYFNGHNAPAFPAAARRNLRDFVDQGGFVFAEACCGSPEFDRGLKELIKEVFPEPEYQIRPLSPDHPIWRAKHLLSPEIHPLWGIEHGCRTVLIYSPRDLSCYWNQLERSPANPAVIKAFQVGQNVIDYATGREMPADKLTMRESHESKRDAPVRGALRIAKLEHGGEWNIAPRAIPNLMETLRRPPINFDVSITQKVLHPRDPNLIYYPLVYLHGRGAIQFEPDDLEALRRHLEPGGGTLFADAACASTVFDESFRRFAARLLPNRPLVSIPPDDALYSSKVGFDLSQVEFNQAAGSARGLPKLEGIKINDRWVIVYSRYDIGCALEQQAAVDCKGYTHASAMKIAANIVIYATLP